MIDCIQKLISPYPYTVKPYRPYGIFGVAKAEQIKIEERPTHEIFSDIFNQLVQTLGNPVFVHSFYGFIFQIDKKLISCGVIEETYGQDVIELILFNRIPHGKKIPYCTYESIKNTVKNVAEGYGFTLDDALHYADNRFIFVIQNQKYQTMLLMKENEFAYTLSKLTTDPVGMRVTPQQYGKCTVRWDDTASVKEKLKTVIEKTL